MAAVHSDSTVTSAWRHLVGQGLKVQVGCLRSCLLELSNEDEQTNKFINCTLKVYPVSWSSKTI